MSVEQEAVVSVRARGSIVVAVAVSTDPVAAVHPSVVSLARIMSRKRMGDRRFRRACSGVRDWRDKKRSGDEGHHQ